MTSKELTEIMANRELTVHSLSDTLGCTPQAIGHWLAGRRDIPEMVTRLMRMFDNDVDDIEYFKSFRSVE